MALVRVQKILAQAGIASRRKAEELILAGSVTINGKTAKLGDRAEIGKDAIKVKGKLLQGPEAHVYLAFYKPKGVISMMSDPEARATLFDYLHKIKARVFPVGRLDFNSEGLLLLTNDGDFAERYHRDESFPRIYRVKVKGHPDAEMLSRLERPVRLSEHTRRVIKPHSVRMVETFNQKASIEVVFVGGGAIDVKAFFEAKGFLVERVIRTGIGHITLHGLEPGHFRFLKASQVEALLKQPELGLTRLEQEATEADEKAKAREKYEIRRAQELEERAASEERTSSLRPVRGPKPTPGARKLSSGAKPRVVRPRGGSARTFRPDQEKRERPKGSTYSTFGRENSRAGDRPEGRPARAPRTGRPGAKLPRKPRPSDEDFD